MSDPQAQQRTFSFRAAAIGFTAMLLLAIWVHFHEILMPNQWEAGPLVRNSPPAGAVGIFLGVMLIGTLVTRLRPRLRLGQGELVVIYAMLVTSAPLMSSGMWHRFLGLMVAIPHNERYIHLWDSFSDKLWPHGPHLIENRRFEQGIGEQWIISTPARAKVVEAEATPVGPVPALEVTGAEAESAESGLAVTSLRLRLPRYQGGAEALVPGERYCVNGLFRLREMSSLSRFEVTVQSDGGAEQPVVTLLRDSPATYTAAGGFARAGKPYVRLPRDLGQHLDLVFTLYGPGRVAMTDLVFFSNEPLARLHAGSTQVRESDLDRLPENERDALLVRPDNLATPRGVWYLLTGYIPFRAWLQPMVYWFALVGAMFACLLGIGVILRRQWAEHERFTFPMIVLPRLLLEQKEQDGRLLRPLVRKRAFHVGVVLALLFSLLQGAAHYVPGLPNPTINFNLAEYFSSPAMKAYIMGFHEGRFEIAWLFVAIAFFVDLELLASILLLYFVAKIPFYLAEVFAWKNLRGPVDNFPFAQEQNMGAFLALGIMVLWVSRKHLAAVVRRVLGDRTAVDDSQEAFSYRTAVGLILLSFVVFAAWGYQTEMGVGNALFFFGYLVACGVSASRIRTECGAPAAYFTPYFPSLIFSLLGGLAVFNLQTMVMAYVAAGFMVGQFLVFAPTQVEMLQLGNEKGARPRGVAWGLVLGLIGGVLLGGYVLASWGYGAGGDSSPFMKRWVLDWTWYIRTLDAAVIEANTQTVAAAAQGIELGPVWHVGPLIAGGVGMAITLLLMFLRAYFVGFWLNPLGYVLAHTYFINMLWPSLLVAWAVKWLSLKIGGPKFVREQMTPFFAGVFCGCVAGMVLWDGVALLVRDQVPDVFTAFP